MPALQNVFPTRMDAGLPGGAAMSRYSSNTGIVEGAPIAFGAAVMRGTDARQIKTFAAGGGAFLGIARQDKGVTGPDSSPVGKPAAYFEHASGVFVVADGAMAVDAVVRFNTANGRFTTAAASGTVLECTGWTVETPTTAAGQLAIIRR
jgi:hypothetical protein